MHTCLSPSHILTDVLWAWNLRATVNVYRSGGGGNDLVWEKRTLPFFPYKVGHFFSPTEHATRDLVVSAGRVGHQLASRRPPARSPPGLDPGPPQVQSTRCALYWPGEGAGSEEGGE